VSEDGECTCYNKAQGKRCLQRVKKKRCVSLVLDMIANFDDPKLSKKKRIFTIDDNFLEMLREEHNGGSVVSWPTDDIKREKRSCCSSSSEDQLHM
jgi:hypothetical protein